MLTSSQHFGLPVEPLPVPRARPPPAAANIRDIRWIVPGRL